MQDKPVALVIRANQGGGLQVGKEFVAHGLIVLVGSRNFEKGQVAPIVEHGLRGARCAPVARQRRCRRYARLQYWSPLGRGHINLAGNDL